MTLYKLFDPSLNKYSILECDACGCDAETNISSINTNIHSRLQFLGYSINSNLDDVFRSVPQGTNVCLYYDRPSNNHNNHEHHDGLLFFKAEAVTPSPYIMTDILPGMLTHNILDIDPENFTVCQKDVGYEEILQYQEQETLQII